MASTALIASPTRTASLTMGRVDEITPYVPYGPPESDVDVVPFVPESQVLVRVLFDGTFLCDGRLLRCWLLGEGCARATSVGGTSSGAPARYHGCSFGGPAEASAR